jgi:hypothetical protein
MTTIEIRPEFDPTLQPIGYALAAELLTDAVPELPIGPDLFGWELDASHDAVATALAPVDGRGGSPLGVRPTGAALQLPTV